MDKDIPNGKSWVLYRHDEIWFLVLYKDPNMDPSVNIAIALTNEQAQKLLDWWEEREE